MLLPGQDMRTHFSFELAKGARKKPPIILFAMGRIRKKPWVPQESAQTRALDTWMVPRNSHKRPSNFDLAVQARIPYSVRFILSGDLGSEWETFGGIGLQFTHLGIVHQMAVAENATVAQLYDGRVLAYADELSKSREWGADIIKLTQEGDQRIKRDVLRECGVAQAFGLSTWKPNKGHRGRVKDEGKGKGKDKKGRVKGKDRPSDGQRQKNAG